jgi:hypothetical protein
MPMAGTSRSTGSLRGADTLPRGGGLLSGPFGSTRPQGLLGAYDPAAMRRAALSRGLLGAGIGLLSQGNSRVPIGFGESLGHGLAGFASGLDAGKQGYYDMLSSEREQMKWQREQEENQAFDDFVKTMDPDIQAYAQADREGVKQAPLRIDGNDTVH